MDKDIVINVNEDEAQLILKSLENMEKTCENSAKMAKILITDIQYLMEIN